MPGRSPVIAKGAVEEAIGDQIEQVGVYLIPASAKLIGGAQQVLDYVCDLAEVMRTGPSREDMLRAGRPEGSAG